MILEEIRQDIAQLDLMIQNVGLVKQPRGITLQYLELLKIKRKGLEIQESKLEEDAAIAAERK